MEIIPFGKYKGQPLEVLQNDKSYLDWLVQQDWFKQRYQTLNAIIINNFQQPTETPEHNRIQAMFLNYDFTKKFCDFLICISDNTLESDLQPLNRYDRFFDETEEDEYFITEFEKHAVDVTIVRLAKLDNRHCMVHKPIKIEVKPVFGDDFPAILRQMESSKSTVLVYENYNGIGVSLEDVVKIFKCSNKEIICVSDINSF